MKCFKVKVLMSSKGKDSYGELIIHHPSFPHFMDVIDIIDMAVPMSKQGGLLKMMSASLRSRYKDTKRMEYPHQHLWIDGKKNLLSITEVPVFSFSGIQWEF